MSVIRLDWSQIHSVQSTTSLESVLQKHSTVFRDEVGLMKTVKATICVKPDAQPRYFRPCHISYFMRDKVNFKLDKLQANGIISAVRHSEWAAPIVPVLKADGHSVRICGDYKVTVNHEAQVHSYPLPRIDDLFLKLAGGTVFSKIDLASAYLQIELDDDSKKYTTINTPKGLFQYNRLPFGILAAPAIFQQLIENLFSDLPYVSVYLDDILVSGTDLNDHLQKLDTVLCRFHTAGLTVKQDKCSFAVQSVEYLGHTIDKNGLHPSPNKLRAIQDVPEPTNLSELRSFIGLLNYYNKFIPNLACILFPFYRLMQKGNPWTWTTEHKNAFLSTKNCLQLSSLLTHFDPLKELIIAADAFPICIGAVLSHHMDDGSERPIAFTSRSLAPRERKYSQIEKEALVIVFATQKFHQYLNGGPFCIYSDQRPLQFLFDETRQVPPMASARIQHWALMLSTYNYCIYHRSGSKMGNADVLSRLPLPETVNNIPEPAEHVFLIHKLNESPITASQIKSWTDTDPVLSRIRRFILCG